MSAYTALQNRIANWSQRRHGKDVAPLTLTGRRIYILPTRSGLLYGVAVMAMGLAGMNYDNNLALLLALILGSVGLVAMHHCQRNLVGLRINLISNTPVFAGEHASLSVQVDHDQSEARPQLQLSAQYEGESLQSDWVQAAVGTPCSLSLQLPSTQRGWLAISRWSISTRYPFGLFRAWAVLHLPLRCVIYPRPSHSITTPPPSSTHSTGSTTQRIDGDDFYGFRAWQPGDAPQHIAWKQYARGQGLLIATHSAQVSQRTMFDWATLPAMPIEARLSLLTRWIIDADHDGVAYGLNIPSFSCAPQRGEAHRRQCLTALALFQRDGA